MTFNRKFFGRIFLGLGICIFTSPVMAEDTVSQTTPETTASTDNTTDDPSANTTTVPQTDLGESQANIETLEKKLSAQENELSTLYETHEANLDNYDKELETLYKQKSEAEKNNHSTTDIDAAIEETQAEKQAYKDDNGITAKEEEIHQTKTELAEENKKAATLAIESMVLKSSYFSITGKVRNPNGTIREGNDRLAVGNEHELSVIGSGAGDQRSIFYRIISLIISVVGTLAILFYVVAGVFFITAQNDSQVQKAKSIMLNTSLGLVIVFCSYLVVQLVLSFLFR